MSGAFYSRYVPPAPSAVTVTAPAPTNGHKRKHEARPDDGTAAKKSKKHKQTVKELAVKDDLGSNGDAIPNIAHRSEKKIDKVVDRSQPEKSANEPDSLNQHTSTEQEPHGKSQKKKKRSKESKDDTTVDKIRQSPEQEPEALDEEEDGDAAKHSSILSKFKRSRETTAKVGKSSNEAEHSIVEDLHGLEPLPQPEPAPATTIKPAYSTLPQWLANPTYISPLDRKPFGDLGIDSRLLGNLESSGMKEAFSVQAAVLSLLLKGDSQYNGDVCISAATGSGKTLAYILPMTQALMGYATRRLRGLIVVPTRELVKQAREVCEVCASGTGLRIATAVGARSLKDEEEALIEQYEEYKPAATVDRSIAEQGWLGTDLEGLFAESKQGVAGLSTPAFRSKADILICTPGRLVEHLRSTKGFGLDHLEWLVIDEADRLMSESFQEWVEFVIPALDRHDAADQKLATEFLRRVRLPSPERLLQKVVLSATFSADISKLNSLQLRNPKLLVVGDQSLVMNGEEGQNEVQGLLNLPSTLEEFAVAVGDGLEKPLYLLKLLQTRLKKGINQTEAQSVNGEANEEASETSDSDSDSDLKSTSSDESTSDDDSDIDSDLPSKSTNARRLIFAGSTESAQRLFRLLTLLDPAMAGKIGTLTKTSAASSRKALSLLRRGKLTTLIATDRASRGLDIPELDYVVSYDVPNSVTTYVHRIGRTARAGLGGQAWTLVAHREARWFWNEIGKGMGDAKISRSGRVQKLTIELDQSEEERERYEKALKELGEEVKEKRT